jgi:cytochrome c-type biogenesis protein CcmH
VNVSAARLALAFALLVTGAAWAREAPPAADDPVLEKRVMALAAELRCLVCQNESLAESRADLAVDLRNQIRERMRAGASERDVVRFLTERYGDFVLYRPPLKASTALLWFGPLLLLAAGVIVLFGRIARRRAAPERELSESEHARAARLLESADEANPR